MTILFILINVAMIGSALLVVHRYSRHSSFSQQVTTVFLLYFSQVGLSVLFLGVVVKNLSPLLLFALTGVPSCAVLIALRREIKPAAATFYKSLGNFFAELSRSRDYFLYFFLLLFGIQAVWLLVQIYYLPPHVCDVFAYHLHPVVEWVQQGKIPLDLDSPVVRADSNTLGTKLLHFWFVYFNKDLTWVELPQYIYGLLLSLSSYALMRKLHLARNNSLRYAVLIYFIPSVLLGSRTCQDHLALTAVIVMTVLYFLDVFYSRDHTQIIFLFLSFGLLLGVKITAPQVIAVLFVALLVSKAFDFFTLWAVIKTNWRTFTTGIGVAAALGIYWYIKNIILFGNPSGRPGLFGEASLAFLFLKILFACFVIYLTVTVVKKLQLKNFVFKNRKIFIVVVLLLAAAAGCYYVFRNYADLKIFISHTPPIAFTGKSFDQQVPDAPLPRTDFGRNLLYFPHRVTDTASVYNPDLPNISGFGMQFFVFGLIACLLMAYRCLFKRDYQTPAGFIFLFSSILLGSYFLYYFSPYSYRLYVFFPVFGMILWASLWEKMKLDNVKGPRIYADVLLTVMILFNLVACVFAGDSGYNSWKTLFTMDNSSARTSTRFSPFLSGEDWQYIDRYIPPEEAVAYAGGRDSWVFPYFDNRMTRKVYNLRTMPGFRTAPDGKGGRVLRFTPELKENLIRLRIRFIHINPQGNYPYEEIYITSRNKNVLKITGNLYYLKW